ncbi:MAG: MYG1 family protein [Candidatus Nomurabacteria bacterium]|nr:MYG1 family protein [Candidatus Nomurabacteria bacterium]
MFGFSKKVKLVTHNGSFHSDDVFACATLQIWLDQQGKKYSVHRVGHTDPLVTSGDYVFDIGGIYNPETNRFDHHQSGGAGKRANGIEYASFGLVWKHIGLNFGSKRLVGRVDHFAQAIDATDNGINLFNLNSIGETPFLIEDAISSFNTGWDEGLETYDQFITAVNLAKQILKRLIRKATSDTTAMDIIDKAYQSAENKNLVVIDQPLGRFIIVETLGGHNDTVYAVHPDSKGNWSVVGMRADANTYATRKPLPAAWAGLTGSEMASVSGVDDAIFCHRSLFTCRAKSKEGALQLVKIALKS